MSRDNDNQTPSLLCVPRTSGVEHPVIRGLKWILENKTQRGGRRMSMRALSLAAGLSPGHVEQIINKRQSPDVEVSTLDALARAANVNLDWLRTGKGEPGSYDGSAPEGDADSDVRPRLERDTDDPEGPRRFGDLPGWPEAEAEARRVYDEIPGYAYEAAREQAGARWPRVVTAETVRAFALAWLDQISLEEKIARTRARVRAEIDAFEEQRRAGKQGG